MRKFRLIYSFLILGCMLMFLSGTYGQVIGDTKADSLRRVLDNKTGADKISTQLDLALEILTEDADEARVLAYSALQSAKASGDEDLKMRSFYVMGKIYTEERNDEYSLAYLDSGLLIARAINDTWYIGEILYQVGVNKYRQGEYVEALKSYNEAGQACSMSNNFKTAGSTYSMTSTIFRINGLYDRAIEYIIKSKLNYEKANFMEGSAWTTYLLGRIYADLKLPEKALEYFRQALEIYRNLASADHNQNGVAICYEQLALLNIESQDFKKARENINKALDIYTSDKSRFGMSNVYKHLGVIEYSTGNYLQAENYFTQSLKIKEEVSDILSMPGIYEYTGLSLIKRGREKEGFKTMRQGLDLAISNNQKKIQLDIYSKLAKAYLSVNDYENAIACQDKQIQIQNLILSGAANIKTEQLQAIYEIDEKNSQIAELEKQNEINALNIKQQRFVRNMMIIGIILALFISLTTFLFYNKLRHNNRELNETNATKDRFFAIIAHDLRGPTSGLASLLKHLNSNVNEFSIEELKEILSTLYKSAENVSQLLENLLIWAQSQVARIEYRPKKLKLTDVIQKALDGLIQSAGNKQIDIKTEINDTASVFADPDMVQTILRNIFSNAIKFTPRGGTVVAKFELTNKSMAQISITDNGVGIEKSKLTKIFDLTNAHHTKGTENEMSTGLGLILVKDFVEKNKGVLTLKSKVGKGTTVSFTLPASQGIAAV